MVDFCKEWNEIIPTGIIGKYFLHRGSSIGKSKLIIFLKGEQEKLRVYAEKMSQEFFGEDFGIAHGIWLNDLTRMFKKKHGWK